MTIWWKNPYERLQVRLMSLISLYGRYSMSYGWSNGCKMAGFDELVIIIMLVLGVLVPHAKLQSQQQMESSLQAKAAERAALKAGKPKLKKATEEDKAKFLKAARNGETATVLKMLSTREVDVNAWIDSVSTLRCRMISKSNLLFVPLASSIQCVNICLDVRPLRHCQSLVRKRWRSK